MLKAGVIGHGTDRPGIIGHSQTACGVCGFSDKFSGIYAYSDNQDADPSVASILALVGNNGIAVEGEVRRRRGHRRGQLVRNGSSRYDHDRYRSARRGICWQVFRRRPVRREGCERRRHRCPWRVRIRQRHRGPHTRRRLCLCRCALFNRSGRRCPRRERPGQRCRGLHVQQRSEHRRRARPELGRRKRRPVHRQRQGHRLNYEGWRRIPHRPPRRSEEQVALPFLRRVTGHVERLQRNGDDGQARKGAREPAEVLRGAQRRLPLPADRHWTVRASHGFGGDPRQRVRDQSRTHRR